MVLGRQGRRLSFGQRGHFRPAGVEREIALPMAIVQIRLLALLVGFYDDVRRFFLLQSGARRGEDAECDGMGAAADSRL